MASVKRISTGYKGVFYVERKGERILSIFYRKPGDRKQYEEKLGTSAQGWTAARANLERTRRINGQVMTNSERRQAQAEAKRDAESRPTIERLWELYLDSKGGQLKGVVTDKNRFDLHLRKYLGGRLLRNFCHWTWTVCADMLARIIVLLPPETCSNYCDGSSTSEFASDIVPLSTG